MEGKSWQRNSLVRLEKKSRSKRAILPVGTTTMECPVGAFRAARRGIALAFDCSLPLYIPREVAHFRRA